MKVGLELGELGEGGIGLALVVADIGGRALNIWSLASNSMRDALF